MSAAVMYAARRHARPRLALLLLTLLLIAASLVHLGLGARWIAPQTVLQALLEYNPRNFDQRIIVDLRLVRLAAALLTGAALGVAGLLLQTVIRNPLGEPHILGLNAGASLAVVATSALGLSLGAFPAGRPLTAACGAGLLFGGVMALASAGRGGATPLRITLCGVALSAFASAVTAAILILDEQTLLAMRTWLAGDLAGLNWSTLQTALVPALIGLGVALLIAPRLNVLALGDKVALGLGINLVQTRLLGLLAIALLCGAAVAVRADRFCRAGGAARGAPSGDGRYPSGAAPGGAGGGAGAGAGGHRRPDAGRAAGAGDRGDDRPGGRTAVYLYRREVF